MKNSCLAVLALVVALPLASTLSGTEYKPWYTPLLAPEAEFDVAIQAFRDVDTKFGDMRYSSCDVFVDLGLLLSPTETTSGEFEVALADTRKRTFGFDNIKLTGRYLWLNDVVGDPISLSMGVSLSSVFKPARHDIAVFHHGGIEGEFHIAAGQEFVCESFWTSRWWSVAAIGTGDIGSAWLRGDFHYEWNWWNKNQCDIFLHTLWGLGRRELRSVYYFDGYGPVQHYTVDIGASYIHIFDYGIELKMEYAHRVFAKYCPESANLFIFRVTYPFSL